MFLLIKQTNKKRPLQQWKPLFVLCNSKVWKSLIVLCNNRRFRSYPISVLQQQIIQKVGIFLPFLVSYSITVSRVLKITLECRFIDDFSQTEIDLVLKNIDLCVAKKKKKVMSFHLCCFEFFVEIFFPFYIFVTHVSSLPLLLRFLQYIFKVLSL